MAPSYEAGATSRRRRDPPADRTPLTGFGALIASSPMSAPRPPADAHEWVSFEDPDEERTWVFDVTFLTSNWSCIYGQGCPGVLTGPAPELEHGCCSYGAHFVDKADLRRVERIARDADRAGVAVPPEGPEGDRQDQ